MLDCGANGNFWVEYALGCLPTDVLDEWEDKLAFVCMAESDGRRLTPAFRGDREIIVLSERIVPRAHVAEDHPDVRYFTFAVLHEIAHAIRNHRPPNEITQEEDAVQEEEAYTLAFRWYNDYLRMNHPDLPPFTEEELRHAQARTRAAMLAALGRNE